MRMLRGILPLTLVLLVLVASPAHAASRVGLSWDGETWASSLTGTLFNRAGDIGIWVPGDGEERAFQVRNESADPATLAISYTWPAGASLVEHDDVTIQASIGGRAWATLGGGTTWLPLDPLPLEAGRSTDVRVRAVFHWSSPNRSQSRVVPLAFTVVLSQDEDEPLTISDGHGHGPSSGGVAGPLASTGAPRIRWLVAVALACVGGGLALLIGVRRRKAGAA